ncbi:MAG: M48 family metalloprotease [Pseudomonadota bacterium]
MLVQLVSIVAMAWAAWVLLNLAALILSACLLKPNAPCFNGLFIVMPDWIHKRLTPAEVAAVITHEEGHRHHRHVWENFAAVCLLSTPTPQRRAQQEIEADDYAVAAGHARALASALAKLGPGETNRIARLLMVS